MTSAKSKWQSISECVFWMLAFVLFHAICSGTVYAQEGGGVFENAACNLLTEVLTKDFGAMVTAITGLLAIVAAAAGSFKGAWALIFVSVGAFIYPALVKVLFPNLSCGA